MSPKTLKRKSVFGAAKSCVATLFSSKEKEKEDWCVLDDGSCSINLNEAEEEGENNEETDDSSSSPPARIKQSSSKYAGSSSKYPMNTKSAKVKSKSEAAGESLQLDLDGQVSAYETGDLPLKPSSENKRSSSSDQKRSRSRSRSKHVQSCSPHALSSSTRRD
jgi:hypothetical protein